MLVLHHTSHFFHVKTFLFFVKLKDFDDVAASTEPLVRNFLKTQKDVGRALRSYIDPVKLDKLVNTLRMDHKAGRCYSKVRLSDMMPDLNKNNKENKYNKNNKKQ